MSYRLFKHGKRTARMIAETEYTAGTESLMQDGFGRIVEFRVPQARNSCKGLVKSKTNPWPNSVDINKQEFDIALGKPLHNDISTPMRAYLRNNDYISE